MKNRIIILAILMLSISLSANEIEWEKVEGADFYEIEVINSLGEKVKIITTKEIKLDLKIETIGKYRYRIGSADNNKRISWTNWIDFRVQKNSDKAKEKIILEWELQRLAEIYRIQVSNDSGHIVYEEKLNSNKTYLNLGIGKYKYRVASVNELGKEAWSDWEGFEVKLKTWEVPNALKQANMGEISDKIDNMDSCGLRCNVVKRSALLPGWGQSYRDDPKWRVYAYPILFSSLFFAYYENHKENKAAEREYDSALGAMALAQGIDSDSANLLTYYSYTKILNASDETKHTYSQGNQISLLVVGLCLFNLIDAYYFYDYTVPVSERYKKPSLSIQFYKSNPVTSHLPADSRYEIFYRWNF
ncbi:MAG TPA: DUF5683 domain-containing protein [Leptospiraceae bacterium]|nr:DUF5683 domain-containing protein [Leptospiraceae bacterium]